MKKDFHLLQVRTEGVQKIQKGREVSEKKYIPIVAATFIWIWTTILIKFLCPYFDAHTQNFYRYLAAAIALIAVNLIYLRKEFLFSLKNIRKFFLPVFILIVFQTLLVKGIYLLEPAMVALISKSSVLFVALFSFILFPDERKVMSSRVFITGSLMAIIGVIGVIAGKSNLQLGSFGPGVVLILLGSVLWAVYMITVKRIVRKTDTLVSAGIIFPLAVPFFFVLSLLFGDLSAVLRAPAGVNVILFTSGIFCVGIANAFNYKSIKLIGTTISSNFVLITPFFTAILSYFIFGEVLSFCQILSGIVLVAGCILLLHATKAFSIDSS